MKGKTIYIKGVQIEDADRNDNIVIACGTKGTWRYREIQVSKYHCYSEKALREDYIEQGLSAYTSDELLAEIKKRMN